MGAFQDLTGEKFSLLTVQRRVFRDGNKKTFWQCVCDCGNTTVVPAGDLKNGKVKSCGCLLRSQRENQLEDLSGKKFGRLLVTEFSGFHTYPTERKACWRCICDCGNTVIVQAGNLKSGATKSCGCLQSERTSQANFKHGQSGGRLYAVWDAMIQRTTNPKSMSYKNYGARGIRVCEEWKNSFNSFYKWAMSSGYIPDAKRGDCTIDRIDVDGDYSPNNCRWVDMTMQAHNKRK